MCPLLHGSAIAITFDLGSLEKSRIVRAADDCIVCYDAPPVRIPEGISPFAFCGHQDVCKLCLLEMHRRRDAKCPQCRFPMRGDAFMTLMRIMAKKKKIDDEEAALIEQTKKIERQLQKVRTEKDAMDRLSESHMLTITSLGVAHEVAEEALYNQRGLSIKLQNKPDWHRRPKRRPSLRLQRPCVLPNRKFITSSHKKEANGMPLSDWKIGVVVKQFFDRAVRNVTGLPTIHG